MKPRNSPKNKYRAQITYSRPLKGVGSVISVTADDLETLDSRIAYYTRNLRKNETCNITRWVNADEYPAFDWRRIDG